MPTIADAMGIRAPFADAYSMDALGMTGQQSPGIRRSPNGVPIGWTPQEENAFRLWMNKKAAESGVSADADSLLHAYKYREAFRNNMRLTMDASDNQLHGSSAFKMPNHPNRFVHTQAGWIDSITGRPLTVVDLVKMLRE